MADSLSPRARAILAAVEREVSARLDEIERDAASVAPRRAVVPFPTSASPLRADTELLTALEMGVAGIRAARSPTSSASTTRRCCSTPCSARGRRR